jgi:hypothetical protein
MATRRLRVALWHHRRSLRREAVAQDRAAGHLDRLERAVWATCSLKPTCGTPIPTDIRSSA